jgi:hypothetical protein
MRPAQGAVAGIDPARAEGAIKTVSAPEFVLPPSL